MAEKKAKQDKDAKKKGKQNAAVSAEGTLSLAAHPRAVRRVAQAKGWGGLVGFLAGGYLSLATHTLAEAGFRALVAGIVCYSIVWIGAVFLWRHLVVADCAVASTSYCRVNLQSVGSLKAGVPNGSNPSHHPQPAFTHIHCASAQ